ncbi:MAG TPA: hypothetical protein VFI25_10465 [Planctomycetota bacterium]|jgi:hypothetical protein|nr:hypothetical protein [Planctomycetota bacterium]
MIGTGLLLLLAPSILQGPESRGALPARLGAALDDVRRRDPTAWEALRRALELDPETGRRNLTQHAQYLEDLAAAREAHPDQYERMLAQEGKEKEVREIVQRLQLLGPDSPERLEVVEALRSRLGEWFEVRQELRAFHVQEFEARFGAERDRVEATARDPEAARRAWFERVAEGGSAAIEVRLGRLREGDPVEALAPALVSVLLQVNPEAGQQLAAKADRDPPAFLEALRRITAENPLLLEAARRQAGEEVERQATLREALRRAHALLLPIVRAHGTEVPGEDRTAVRDALQALVDAELAVARSNLAKVGREVSRQRSLLEDRRERKAVVVEIQLSRLIGQGDRFEW